ncbi:thiamine-phosphate kinase [Terriglobus sp.]|uniref:thiamine-phosphate kinase n=1 Tax=Terriglobus sp. TaxID=1889013 RepID=UPI003B00D489
MAQQPTPWSSQHARGGELELIRSVQGRSQHHGRSVTLGIGDDCAILQPPAGHELLVTTDMSLETRHFLREVHPARSVGHRCLARGLSDLAAMGAKPLAAFLSLALPAGMRRNARGRAWVDGFLDGLLALAHVTGTTLAGGDTAAAPGEQVIADIVLTGSAPQDTSLRRSGARAGDLLYVTGALGGAAAELAALQKYPRQFRDAGAAGDHPHLFPQPRLRTGWVLRSRKLAAAAIDVSDGLSTDLHHLCSASGVGAVVRAAALPVHPLARDEKDDGLALALHGGEDYELLFAARPSVRMPKRAGGVPVHCIGRLTRAKDILLQRDGRTEPLPAAGWEHAL